MANEGNSKVRSNPVRKGWAEAGREIADSGDDSLVMGEFGNEADAELAWSRGEIRVTPLSALRRRTPAPR